MKKTQETAKFSLHIPPLMWKKFREVMLQARKNHEEVIGFFFCQRQEISKHRIRYIPKAWVVPAPDCYEHQSVSGLVLKQPFHEYLLNNFLQNEALDVVHIHTHAGLTSPTFSEIDNHYESEYARFLSSKFPHKPHFISGIFDESLQQPQFRLWNRRGTFSQPVDFYSHWFQLPQIPSFSTKFDPMFDRQTVFGETVQQQLGKLSVTLIGCGGIGATFAEQLGRLGVKKWVLIDPDRLETTNLNRMPGATPIMAEQKWHKVHYVKQLLKRIYTMGSEVYTRPQAIEDKATQAEIAATDLIVVATDNHRSRQIAQELALKYMRPLLCLGTHIELKPDNTPRLYCRISVPPLGGGWCLMCGNIINLQQAALESAPVEIHSLAAQNGYLKGIKDPAVFWLNSICASTAVGVIHGMMSGFLNVDSGLDWIYDFPSCTWLKTNPESLFTKDCYFCSHPEATSQPSVSNQEILQESFVSNWVF